MPKSLSQPAERATRSERMWPMDLSLAGLGSLVFYMLATRFRFDDPRPLYNAGTYAIVIPLVIIILSLVTRSYTSKFIEKSVQLAFLFSIFVHLSLLLMAVNVIIFSRYFPDSFTGNEPRRIPVRKTVPDYLFATPSREMTQPDWSKPVDAETASKEVPIEQRSLPPVEKSAERLKMPNEEPEQPIELEKSLVPRKVAESAMPTPANTPGKRARSIAELDEAQAPSAEQPKIDVPQEQVVETSSADAMERSLAELSRTTPAASSAISAAPSLPLPELTPRASMDAGRARVANEDRLPTIGSFGASAQRSTPQQRQTSVAAAGAAPAPVSVAVGAFDVQAERTLSPVDLPAARMSRGVGASISTSDDAVMSELVRPGVMSGTPNPAAMATTAGAPSISAGGGVEATSRRRNGPLGLPVPSGDQADSTARLQQDLASLGDVPTGESGTTSRGSGQPAERVLDVTGSNRGTAQTSPVLMAELGDSASLALDLAEPIGMIGFADVDALQAGVSVSMEATPKIESLSLRPSERKRVDIGGPITPAGTEIAAVESFRRRTMRTQGGAAPSPVGLVGPATEEAIERGLAFLASRQHSYGHWSLQGHGENVILQSDTAATGLCLLAFQGAGYTHQQHQYANVVAKGLEALLAMQAKDGNLYRSENRISDQNVAFYSHGIAALALCEAYGMTRDENLRQPAQLAINYIVTTQHKERGGWRYQPQISSDTSVSGWMMMALKSGELAGLSVPKSTYEGINRWLEVAKASRDRADRYRYNPYAPDTPAQRHGRLVTPTMTAVGMLMRMYSGWRRENPDMQSAADYLATYLPAVGDAAAPQRDTYYWYYATQVMFHMGGEHWEKWNQTLNPILIEGQVKAGPQAGSWDPRQPVPDRWSAHAGRLYLTTMNLLSLEVYYRHLPIYDDTAK